MFFAFILKLLFVKFKESMKSKKPSIEKSMASKVKSNKFYTGNNFNFVHLICAPQKTLHSAPSKAEGAGGKDGPWHI